MVSGIPVCFLRGDGSVPSAARNKLVREARAASDSITHLMWADADMTFIPPSLARLLSHNRDIVGAFGRSRKPPYNLLGKLVDPPTVEGDLHLVERMGAAFVLVKREVYDIVPPPWYFESYEEEAKSPDNPDGLVGEDVNFILKARRYAFKVWCDIEVTKRLGHIGDMTLMGEMEGLPGIEQTNRPNETSSHASACSPLMS